MAPSSNPHYKDAKAACQPGVVERGAGLVALIPDKMRLMCVFVVGRDSMSEFAESNLEQPGNWVMDIEDTHSVAGRARIRAQLQQDIEAFLSQGGRIEEVDTSFQNDAPRKVGLGFNNRAQ